MNEFFWQKLKKLYIKEDGTDEKYELEYPHLKEIFLKIEEKLKDKYSLIEPLGRGGSGIVLKVLDDGLNLFRAMKLPRPIQDRTELIESLDNEIKHLTAIKHENIINIYFLGHIEFESIDRPFPYFIMDFIEDANDLKKRTQVLIEDNSDSKNLKKITSWLADTLYKTSSALKYCHENDILHFDVKPANILIDKSDKPILGDMGFAKKKNDSDMSTVVGFTIFYAHPDLRLEYTHKSSVNRVKKEMRPKEFKKKWDVFAFGKSILEILSLIEQKFPDVVLYDYTFIYLHLSACRMLDGRNLMQDETDRIRQELITKGVELGIFNETLFELNRKEFSEIKYESFDEVVIDFEKLRFNDLFFAKIPELNNYYQKRIQSSDGIPAPFSKRIKAIIEHPVFSRLAKIPHLGLISTIYPTATHTRLEHSLGVFRNCCLYVSALYNDNYNPFFKQLVTEGEIKSLLIASLLHDLGHYPFAHEIEETVKELKHEDMTLRFLENPTKNKDGLTLQQIIENSDWGWGVNLKSVKEILEKKADLFNENKFKNKMLVSILDGPIDVDKLDYLLRDSRRCHLKYGELIDEDRLCRNLTVIIYRGTDDNLSFSIGAYEKGQSAAELLTFARYLMYQSLYWHHTARAIRVMLKSAVSSAMIIKKKSKSSNDFLTKFDDFLGVNTEVKAPTIETMLDFISSNSDENGKEFISLIKDRNYYKRIVTIHFEGTPELEDFLNQFRNATKKKEFNQALQDKIKQSYIDFVDNTALPKISQLSTPITEKTIEVLSKPNQILCDAPPPSFGVNDAMLRFIPEPERLQKNYYSRQKTGTRVSEIWLEVYFKLMKIASKGRVFCNPEIRDSLMATIGPNGIKNLIKEIVKDY